MFIRSKQLLKFRNIFFVNVGAWRAMPNYAKNIKFYIFLNILKLGPNTLNTPIFSVKGLINDKRKRQTL